MVAGIEEIRAIPAGEAVQVFGPAAVVPDGRRQIVRHDNDELTGPELAGMAEGPNARFRPLRHGPAPFGTKSLRAENEAAISAASATPTAARNFAGAPLAASIRRLSATEKTTIPRVAGMIR